MLRLQWLIEMSILQQDCDYMPAYFDYFNLIWMPELTKQGLKYLFDQINATDQSVILQLLSWKREPLRQGMNYYQFTISDGFAKSDVVCVKDVVELLNKEFPSSTCQNQPVISVASWKGKKMETGKIFIMIMRVTIEEKQIFREIGQPVDYDEFEKSNFQNKHGSNKYFVPKQEVQQSQEKQRQPLKVTIAEKSKENAPQKQEQTQSLSANKGIQLKNQQKQSRPSLARITEGGEYAISPISTLYPMMMNFKIKARVINKSQRKEFQSRQKEGKDHYFSIELLDESGQISGVFFSNACNKYYDTIEQGKIYTFQGGSIKQQPKRYSNNQNQYQITFEERTLIELQPEDSTIQSESYNIFSIDLIKKKNLNELVDVLGIVQNPGMIQKLTSRQGEALEKKTLILFDQSQNAIEVTLWRELATNTELRKDQLVCIQNLKVSEYQGEKQLQNTPSTGIVTEEERLAKLDQYKEIKQWFANFQGTIEISRGQDHEAHFLTIQEIEDHMQEKLNNSNDMEIKGYKKFSTVRAFMMGFLLGSSKYYYTSCTNCAKKAEQNGIKWSCQSCNIEFDEPNYRYILTCRIQDFSGQALMTLTDNISNQVLGLNAKQFVEMSDEERNSISKGVSFQEHALLIQSTFNEYNGQVRPRHQVVKIQEDNHLAEAKQLYKLLTE